MTNQAFGPGHPLYDPKPGNPRPPIPRYFAPGQGGYRPQQPPGMVQHAGLSGMLGQPATQPTQAPAQPFHPTINTSIQPQQIYSPQQTQQAVNVAKAMQDQLADPRFQMKQFSAPGRSQDAGTMYAAMPNISAAKSAGALAGAAIPLEDLIANQKHLLSGEMAREDEAMGWGNLLARQYDNQIGTQSKNTSNFLSMLANLLTPDSTDYSSLLGGF